ncbi:MATE family efflux transporter [Aeromicrobium wangtongii]|uniref:Polysaccharide biosynthesis protein n=1 Tax=Aeromicrobium wangtongii TaxID=2969247 RepID=A0ABY5MEE1_9ACTN|nr:polysaccharide biosynthesis protein [Aeromicrobium wangtongii]MCD9197613.1 polysaccharide biosynthesis protein [Aeromicrobium wangtongii]UUP15102.1 polysaccharide biosynthesis protein [Aeromicrobium wangtongii]
MRSARLTMTGGSLVAAGMIGMNVAVYAFNVIAARLLAPHEFGALTALFGIILVGTVAGLGLQAVTARRIAVDRDRSGPIISATVRVTLILAGAVGVVVAVSTVVLTPALKLDSYWPVVLCGAALVPLTIMGAQSGIAQGQERWGALTAIYLGNGFGRLIGGTAGLLVSDTPTSAMVGLAIGSWLPVLAGAKLLVGHGGNERISRRPLMREALLSTHALLAYLVLSNMDSLIARNRLDEHDSGLYASGLILAKAALFFPQFVSVVLFPRLARDTTHHARLRAVSLVAAFGALAVAATAALPRLALILVGGDDYSEITGRLWLFALAGSFLAIVHLLVFDALARHAHGVVVMIWTAVVAVLVSAYGLDVGLTGLVVTVAVVASVLATVVYLAPLKPRQQVTEQ